MSKKILLKYLFMYLSFILGLILYSGGVINIFSSLLVFLGGYISIKNTFDYRLVKRNIDKIEYSKNNINNYKSVNNKDNISVENKVKINPKNAEDVLFVKRTRRYSRVRRKY